MYFLVTITVLVQLLPVGITAQSTVTELSASATPDHSTLTLGVETLTPTPALSSGVALASVTASLPVVIVDSGGSPTLSSTLYTSTQQISPTASTEGSQSSTSDQIFSSTAADGGARNTARDQTVSLTNTITSSSIQSNNPSVSSYTTAESSSTGVQNTLTTIRINSTADVSTASVSDVNVPITPSASVSATFMFSAVDVSNSVPTLSNPTTPMVSSGGASENAKSTTTLTILPSSSINDLLASMDSTAAMVSAASSTSQMTTTSVIVLESSFNRVWSSTMDVFSSSTPSSMVESVTIPSSAKVVVDTSVTYNPIISSTMSETIQPTIVSSAYLASSHIQNSATVPLRTSKVISVITSVSMMSDVASSQIVVSNVTDMLSPTNIVESSSLLSEGAASSDLLKSYSSMLDMTSNLDGVSQIRSIPITPTKASSIVESYIQTTMPVVLDSSPRVSALSSSLFSQPVSSVVGAYSSQSTMSPLIPTMVLTSESATVSLPALSTMTFGQSSALNPTNVILPSSVLPIISEVSGSKMFSSSNISEMSPPGVPLSATQSITVSASYSLPSMIFPTVMESSTVLNSSIFVPQTAVSDSFASLSGTLSLRTPVTSDFVTVPGSLGSSSPMMSSTRTFNVSDLFPQMSPSPVSSPYMPASSVDLNMTVVSPTSTMPASSPNMYQTPTLSSYQSSASISIPILPTRSSDYMSSVFPTMMSPSSISFYFPHPISTSSGSLSSMLPPISVIPTGSASSVISSGLIGSVSPASGYQMTSSMNISYFSMSSVTPSTNFLPFSSTNVTGSSVTIASSVTPSFIYSTDMYTSTASLPLLVSPTPQSTFTNPTRSVSILTPTELSSAPSVIHTVDGTLSTSFTTNLINSTMAVTSSYMMNSSAIHTTAGVNSTVLLPTAVHSSSITPSPSTMLYTSTLEAMSSMTLTNNASALASVSVSGLMSSMSSMGTFDSSTSSISLMTSTMSSLTQPSSKVTSVTQQTVVSSISSQEPSSPVVVMSTPSVQLSPNMTSTPQTISPFETASSVLPTPSVVISLNTTIIHGTNVPQMSSSLSINMSSSVSTSVVVSPTQPTSQMSSVVTMPTSSDVTTPTTIIATTPTLNVTISPSISTTPSVGENVTSTPALNITMLPSITTTPTSVENVTSSENFTDLNMTTTLAVNMTSIPANTTEMMSTSVVTTTPAPTTTSTTTEPPTTTSSFVATYWTVTDIMVPVSVNVSGTNFINQMELGLANLYVKAYSRKQDIDATSFDSRRRKKRRRRTATVDDIMVTMQDVRRDATSPEAVSMMYTVEKAELPVPSVVNAETIDLVSDQEMAIELRYVVTKKGKPLNFVEPVTTTTTVATTAVPSDNTQIWIIAIVAGGVVILVVIAIVGLCIALKKSKKSGVDEEAEPRLMNLKNAPLDDEEEDIRSSGHSNSKYSSMTDKGSSSNLKVQSPKKQSYEVSSDTKSKEEDQHLYAEVKKPKKPDLASKIGRSKGSEDLGSENTAEDAELLESPKKKKGEKGRRKNKRKDEDHENDTNEVVVRTVHPANLLVPQSEMYPENAYYSAEEEDELKKRKAAERKKNKQRIREKKKKEKRQDKSADQLMVEYLAAQEEIDSVLEAPPTNQELPEVFVHKKKKGSKNTLEGHDNMALTAEESLNVARSRMHELLDDAFSLISPSAASIGQNQPPEDEGSYDVRGSSTMKHSPMKMEAYKGEPILQTWSPYRAADQVALISMPNKMQTTIGRTPSGRSKRPAADLVGTKSKGNDIPKPAFLKSRDLISTKGSTVDLSSTKSQNGDLASRTGRSKAASSENTDEHEGETTEILQPNDQFEDTEISKENSMLPSIRARKMAKAAKKRAKNGGGGMEMKTLNGKVAQKHKEPFKNVPSGADEMDIISRSVQSAVTPESTVNSIRNEIRSGLPDKNVVTSFSGPGRNSRASGSLVDIA